MLTTDSTNRAEVSLPPVLPEQFRLLFQAWTFVPSTTQCSASSRGTWFGLGAPK